MKYKQKHPETCLGKCLMILVEKLTKIKIPDKYELDLLFHTLRYSRDSIAVGSLEKITRDFPVKIEWLVESDIFFEFTIRNPLPKNINLTQQPINIKSIKPLLSEPLIIYVDRFHLWQEGSEPYFKYHYPHFIIINRMIGGDFEIIDPDDGQIRIISKNILSRAISSFRNHLWMCPMVIQVNRNY